MARKRTSSAAQPDLSRAAQQDLSSAAQPSYKKRRVTMKGHRETDSAIVCFIACPTNIQDFTRISNRNKFVETLRNAIEAGADIINISLSKIDCNDRTNISFV